MADSLDTAQVRELVAGNRRLLTGTNPFPTREEWVGGALDALAASNDALTLLVEERDRLGAAITAEMVRDCIRGATTTTPFSEAWYELVTVALNRARGLNT